MEAVDNTAETLKDKMIEGWYLIDSNIENTNFQTGGTACMLNKQKLHGCQCKT